LVLPFGIKALDRHLPGGGLALGAHEVAGGGACAINGAAAALFAAGIAARTRGKILWCFMRPDLFAPAFAQAGLMPDRVIYVEVGDEKSVLICFEEGLRHGGLGAVVAEVARLSMTASRRLVYVKRDVAANFRFHLKASRHPLRQSVPLPWRRRAALHSGIERLARPYQGAGEPGAPSSSGLGARSAYLLRADAG
jgi:hypothetical protein